jgi:hypothetical protein
MNALSSVAQPASVTYESASVTSVASKSVLSNMAYQMGRGLKGFLVQLGEPARRSDLVGIFDAWPGMELASVAEQQDFKRAWLRSLGFQAGPANGTG